MTVTTIRAVSYTTSPLLASKVPAWRSRVVVSIFTMSFALLFARLAYLTLTAEPYESNKVARAAIAKDSLPSLVLEIERLTQLSTRVNSLSLNELQQALQRSVEIAGLAAIDMQEQARSWSEIKLRIQEDKRTHDALKSDLLEMKNMHAAEVVRIKAAIDTATKPSMSIELFNYSVSFLMGVLSSILASWIYDQRKRDKDDPKVNDFSTQSAQDRQRMHSLAAALRLERYIDSDGTDEPAFLRRHEFKHSERAAVRQKNDAV